MKSNERFDSSPLTYTEGNVMKRFLIGFTVMALVMIASASHAQAERGRRGGHSDVTYFYVPTATYYVPATVAVPTYVTPAYVAPTIVAPTTITPVVATPYQVGVVTYVQTVHRTGRRGR